MKELAVNLRLRDINHLFVAPDISPFSDHYYRYSSRAAMEHILGELYGHPPVDGINLTILLPPDHITPGLDQRAREAIERYCEARTVQSRHEMNKVRYQAHRALPVALVGLLVLIQGSLPLMEARSYWLQVIGNGLNVAGWVAVWFPLDALIFQLWLSRQEKQAYRILQNIRVSIQPDS